MGAVINLSRIVSCPITCHFDGNVCNCRGEQSQVCTVPHIDQGYSKKTAYCNESGGRQEANLGQDGSEHTTSLKSLFLSHQHQVNRKKTKKAAQVRVFPMTQSTFSTESSAPLPELQT